jgi:chitin disaccharide deacetylase
MIRSMSRLSLALLALVCLLPITVSAQQKSTVAERLGYPPDSRLLVIHADDFGMLHSVNRATSEALVNHWITSASILVPCPWFPEAAAFAKAHPDLDLGIHVALTSEWTPVRWRPISPQPAGSSLLDRDGYLPLDETMVAQRDKPDEVATEVHAQLEKAKAAGVNFSHLDAHMRAITRTPQLLSVYVRAAAQSGVPALVLDERAGAQLPPSALLIDREITMQPGVSAADWQSWYRKQLTGLAPGVYQLTIHLGFDDDELRAATADHPDWGAAWRQHDYDTVRSAEFRQFLRDQHFILVSWRDLSRALKQP